MGRLHAIDIPPRQAPALVREKAEAMAPQSRAGDFVQGMMDLGATVCTPRTPSCGKCPLTDICQAYRDGAQDRYPVRAKKAEKPLRRGAIFVLLKEERVFVERRPSRGLFGGMNAFPSTPFTQDVAPEAQNGHAPCAARWREMATVLHVFTHFRLEARIFVARIGPRHAFLRAGAPDGWVDCARLTGEGLPTLMRKAASIAGLIGD
jgi:A/G-specific adenine glycosylase